MSAISVIGSNYEFLVDRQDLCDLLVKTGCRVFIDKDTATCVIKATNTFPMIHQLSANQMQSKILSMRSASIVDVQTEFILFSDLAELDLYYRKKQHYYAQLDICKHYLNSVNDALSQVEISDTADLLRFFELSRKHDTVEEYILTICKKLQCLRKD